MDMLNKKALQLIIKSSEDELYKEVEKYIHDEATEFEFKYSIFEDFLIIYRAKQKREPIKMDFDELLGLKEKS